MYKISFNLPNLPKGGEIDITGLNDQIFENGKSYIISDEAAEQYRRLTPVVLEKDGEVVGATLLEAFKDRDDVTVEVYTPKKKEEGDK